jgi:hypothetical protein
MKALRKGLRRALRRAAAGLAAGLAVSAGALGATAAQAAAPGTPQYCIETMTCRIPDFNGMSMLQRLQFIRGLSDGPSQQFRSGFMDWRALEGVIEFFNDRGLGQPGTWISYTDGGILEGVERGIAMAAGMDSAGDMGNSGADQWRAFLVDMRAGRLSDRVTHDHEWGLAEQASTNSGVSYANGLGVKPTNLEDHWFAWSQVFRWIMINEAALRSVPLAGGALGPLLDEFTDVTNARNTYFWTTLAWNSNAALTLLGDITGNNLVQLAVDLYNFLTTNCTNCSGGGQNPPPLPSVYDVPGGGSFRTLWNQQGGMSGLLGDPTSNWYGVTGGQAQNFAGATAYWGPSTGTHEIHGAIRDRYNTLGGPNSSQGLPTSNEQNAPGGGRENTFAGHSCGSGSVILWTPATGAHQMQGCIYNTFLTSLGGPGGTYGYPTSDELTISGGWKNYMSGTACGSTHGSGIYASAQLGLVVPVRGCAFQTYKANGETTNLGFPVAPEYTDSAGWHQYFQNGHIDNGVVTYYPTCTNYGGPTITGPNACGGSFHTAPPPGKPASGNVWFSGGGVGLFGQEIWTYGNGTTATSTAVYNLAGLDTIHVMQLQAYIPNNYSDASHAHYHYCSPGGGCADGYVNQNNYTNQWATFGAVCTTDGTATVVLADDGGDVYPAIVGADAIRAVRTSLVC